MLAYLRANSFKRQFLGVEMTPQDSILGPFRILIVAKLRENMAASMTPIFAFVF